jgi:hypothetical protein
MRIILVLLFATALLAAVEPCDLASGPDGRLHLTAEGDEVCAFAPVAADGGWKFAAATAVGTPSPTAPLRFALALGHDAITGEAQVHEHDGAADAQWLFSSDRGAAFNCLAISSEFSVPALAGGTWRVDDARGVFPALLGEAQLFAGEGRALIITQADGRVISLSFPTPTPLLIQDNRRWGGGSFTLRVGRQAGRLAAREGYTLAMTIAVPGGLRCRRDLPVVLAADADWVPLATELDIVPGSALDLSGLGLTEAPCGAHGRVIATADGHFAYAGDPGTPRRFYGVNLCFSAQYLAKDQVDRLLDRLVRLGYNCVRIHHYEFALTKPEWKPGFAWDAERVDQLDYLMAGCAKRGLWLTTDLYVSRPVPGIQIGLTGDQPDANRFKLLVPVYEPAYQDWATFARKLLDRVNPYTGMRVAEDPALAWISLINESWVTGFGEVKRLPQWTVAWNRWLAARYPARAALGMALGDLADGEDPATGSVALPAGLTGAPRARLCQVFLADTERTMAERMRRFLRDELKCQALITNLNCGFRLIPGQATRASFDYVDDHFYVDHPEFLEGQWRLPSRCRNANPIRDGAPGGRSSACLRIWGRPFAVSEFNYSAPGRFRGVGGVLTGALAALQDWDAVWRFAYGHKDKDLFTPAPLDYFNLANDPLNQAADRAAVLLFLRRDLAPATGRVALVMPSTAPDDPTDGPSLDALGWLALTTRIGCAVVDDPAQAPSDAVAVPLRAAADRAAVAALLGERHLMPAADSAGVIRSEGGEIAIDQRQGVLTIDTLRTAGGYADPGHAIAAPAAGVRVEDVTTGATVFVSSLDGAPIRSASRLLVTHLTDLQNTGASYGESARQTLLAWGGLPHLVRDGGATVRIALAEPAAYRVWALSTSGRRLEQVAASSSPDGLSFAVRVRGPDGARMLYEVAKP